MEHHVFAEGCLTDPSHVSLAPFFYFADIDSSHRSEALQQETLVHVRKHVDIETKERITNFPGNSRERLLHGKILLITLKFMELMSFGLILMSGIQWYSRIIYRIEGKRSR
uniref:Uncharacterized protein n=1 Tax=Paramoeba aestuarina TaxID=180227 RepID=A0A7S4UBQ9_9EUKA|mmetsp:Transcript_5769/g.8716  ORF Transcript_5769/g.8716 Transcript_5769/m.8716 type:complete len:111 (+) Transcript_5769:353-685(+)